MQQRWEAMLNKVEEEAPKIQREAADAPSVADQAKDATRRVQNATRAPDLPPRPAQPPQV